MGANPSRTLTNPPGDALVVRETKRAWRLFARLWRNYWWTTETIRETMEELLLAELTRILVNY